MSPSHDFPRARPRAARDAAVLERWAVRTHDTASGEDLPGIGHAEGDLLRSWHVSDKPEKLLRFLRRRGNLVAAFGERGRRSELGPGLYLGSPRFWQGRSTNKWEFLYALDERQLHRLLQTLELRVEEARGIGYITASERERAIGILGRVRQGLYADGPGQLVDLLANQPYNIAFWRREFLEPIGIAPSPEPAVVEVLVRGRFAELAGSYPPREVLRHLRRSRLQGAFTRAGMGTNPELVVWNPRAVVDARLLENPP